MREERCSKQPGRSWIFSVSLGEFAMASQSCCAPFECFCFLLGEIVTISAQNANCRKYKCRASLLCKLCCLRCRLTAVFDPLVIIYCVYCSEEYVQRQMPHSAFVCTLCMLASVCTDLGSSAPTVLQSQRELCAACQGCLAWSAGDQWEKGLDGLESQLSIWSSTPTGAE